MNIRRILVPTDYSAGSRPSLAYAMCLANKLDAAIDLVHAWQAPSQRTHETRAMAAFVEANRHEHPALQGRCELGAPADVVVAVAADGYDLVVLSTHGRTGLSAVWTRSIAETVVRLAPCAVLTVHADTGTQLDYRPTGA